MYYPIAYVYPLASNTDILMFDQASTPELLSPIQTALASGQPFLGPPSTALLVPTAPSSTLGATVYIPM